MFYINAINSQIIADDPFCVNSTPKECISSQINSADLIVEATSLIKKKYEQEDDYILTTVYRIEKIFKGAYSDSTITIQLTEDKVLKGLGEKNIEFKLTKSMMKSGKTGVTSILLFKKINHVLEPIISNASIYYSFNQNTIVPKEKKDYLVYKKVGIKSIEFETSEDVYNFILSHNNTRCQDVTYREFVKKKERSNKSFLRSVNSSPIITDYTDFISGGTNEILTITGENFGAVTGRIEFEYISTINDGFIILDEFDMSVQNGATWSSEEINIRVPGDVHDLALIILGEEIWSDLTLLSSRFRIAKYILMGGYEMSDWTDAPLNITYSLYQDIDADDGSSTVNSKKNINLSTINSSGNINFVVHQDVFEDCSAMSQINKALKEWKCKTGIAWRVVGIDNSPPVKGDGLSTISFTEEGDNFDGRCNAYGNNCALSYFFEYQEYDILISQNPDVSPIYETMLHELGHAFGLNHTKSGTSGISDLM